MSPLRQQLGQATAHVVLVEVEQHHRRDDLGARHDVVRRQDSTAERRGHRDRTRVAERGRPARAGCDDHAGKAELQHVLRREPAVEVGLDVGKLVELSPSPVPHPNPGGKSGQPRLVTQAPSELGARLGERDLVAALAERPRCLEPRGARSDHEHAVAGSAPLDLLGMPAPPPLLADGGVLGAADRDLFVVARVADVAADALVDVVFPPLLDLFRQEGVGDGGAGRADEIEHSTPDLRHHGVGRSESPDPHYRLRRHLPCESDVGLLIALIGVARVNARRR